MKVLLSDSPPFAFNNCRHFPTISPNIACPFPGYAIEILEMLSNYANILFEPYVVNSSIVEWGNFENGSWTGMMKILENGTVDVMNDVMQYTEIRDEYFDYSYPLYNLQIVYITKQKPHDVKYYLWDAIKPFSIQIWITLLITFLILTTLATLTQFTAYRLGLLTSFNITDKFWTNVRTIFSQHNNIHFQTVSDKINFVVFGLLFSILFTKLYEAFLLSPLLVEVKIPPFKDFEDLLLLIKSGTYHIVVDEPNYRAYWYYEFLRTSNDSHFKKLRDALSKNPLIVVKDISLALETVELGNYVYPTQQDQPEMVEARMRCGLTFMDVGLPQTRGYFLFHRNSPFLPAINKAIRMNTGFIAHIFNKYFTDNFKLSGRLKHCSEINFFEATKPLTLMSSFGIFMIFFICISVSGIFFVFEWIYFRFQSQRKKFTSSPSESDENSTIDSIHHCESKISIASESVC